MLLIINHTMLHFMRFRCGTLRFREFLMHYIGLHMRVVVLNSALILSDRHLLGRNFDAATIGVD